MLSSLVRKTLRDDRRATIGWAVGVAVFVTIYVSAYSQVGKQSASAADSMPKAVRDLLGWQSLATGAGYLEATIYNIFTPLLLIMFSIMMGSRGIAIPEERGTLEILMANPMSRRRFILDRFTSLVTVIVLVALVPWALVLAMNSSVGTNVPAANISAASLGLMLLALLFGSVAFAIGAATGRRSLVLAVSGVLAVATYLARILGGVINGLGWLRWISPFQYYLGSDPLRSGFHVGYLAVLVAATVVMAAVAVVTFERRDVGV